MFGNAIAMFLSGINVLKFQVVVSVLMSIIGLVLKVILGKWLGISGVIWGTVFASLPGALALGFYAHILLTRRGVLSRGQWRSAPPQARGSVVGEHSLPNTSLE